MCDRVDRSEKNRSLRHFRQFAKVFNAKTQSGFFTDIGRHPVPTKIPTISPDTNIQQRVRAMGVRLNSLEFDASCEWLRMMAKE